MKPWFLKEGDVIDFPKKDDKVIKLPTIDHYDSFFDGVRDLQTQLERGDITKTVYNKLYTDLIHRFAKKESMEPWFLRESKEQQLDQKLDNLVNIAKKEPKAQNIVGTFLDKIIDYGKNLLGNKQESSLQEQPIVNAQMIDQKLQNAHFVIDLLKKEFGPESDKIFDKILQATDKLSIQPEIAKLVKGLKQQEFEKSRVGREDLSRAITLVAGKVNGTLEQLEALYKQQKQKEGDEEVEIKTSPGADQIRKDITDIIRGLIERYKDQYRDPTEFQKFEKLILDFLNSSIKGIVPLSTLIKRGAGNIVDEVKGTKFHQLVDNNFVQELLSKIPGKTSGNWGPGELGLAILGSPVSKGDKGDIQVGGETIELKASNNPQKGGRIGSEIVKSGKAGEQEYLKALDSFLKDVGQKRTGKKIKGKKIYANGKTKDVAINALNVNQGWYQVINQYIANSKVSRERVSQLLSQVINSALNVAEKTITPNLSKSVNADRTINWDEFYKEYLRILLAYYNQIEEVKKILIIRPKNGNFRVVDATDINGIWKLIQDNKLAKSTHLIDFSDSQAKLSPQIGIY